MKSFVFVPLQEGSYRADGGGGAYKNEYFGCRCLCAMLLKCRKVSRISGIVLFFVI